MTLYGNTCPMCCGDIDSDGAGPSVCPSCGCNTEASASAPSTMSRSDAEAFSVSAIDMGDPAVIQTPAGRISPSHDIQIQASAGMALAQIENVSTVPG
jgi:hypothetical protein